MLVKDILIQEAEEIICLECGNCCPNYCGAKKGVLCLSHPSIPGNENKYRGMNCLQKPLFFALNMGVACPAVLKRVEELTGDTFNTVEHPENGVNFIENYGPFVPNRELPSMESGFWLSMCKEV